MQTELTASAEDGTTRVVTSKLNLVDLAGSERQSKTCAQVHVHLCCSPSVGLRAKGGALLVGVKQWLWAGILSPLYPYEVL